MSRTANQVSLLLAEARAKSTRCWVPETDGGPLALNGARARFDAVLTVPVEGEVRIEPHVASMLQIEPGQLRVWFLTSESSQRVFFDEAIGSFGVAWGPDSESGEYVDLGFRTDDPIDAFLA